MPKLLYLAAEFYEVDNGCYSWLPYPSLKELYLEDLPTLDEWPTSTMVHDVHGHTREVLMFPCLRNLTVIACPKLRPKPHIPSSVVDFFVSNSSRMLSLNDKTEASLMFPSLLRRLWIKNCEISSGWQGLQYHVKLEDLVLESCDELESLPEVMQHHTSLQRFRILYCTKLRQLPKWMANLKSLVSLEIIGCSELVALPEALQHIAQLENFS